MNKIKIFFIISLFFILCTGSLCISDLSDNFLSQSSYTSSSVVARPVYIDEETSEAIQTSSSLASQTKQNNNHNGVTKNLLIILCFAIITPFIIAIYLLSKFNSLVNNADKSVKTTVEETVDKLNELQNKFKNTYDVKDFEDNSQKLVREINDFMEDLSKEEIDKVEIKPVKNSSSTPNKQYTQQEKMYVKPQIDEPLLVSKQPISKTKGFYLVDCGAEKVLVGYIKDEIFILNKFKNIQNKAIQVRLTERVGHRNIYMVKNGTYKALVQVEKENMKVLLEM